jgi:hypothetical protein
MKPVGALLVAATADSAVTLSLATRCWLAVCHSCQRSKTGITQRPLPAETMRTFNQHKAAVSRAGRVACVAAASGRCGP